MRLTTSSDIAFLRHECLNLITLVNFLVDDIDCEKEKRDEILKQMKLLTLFTAHKEVILGKKKTFSKSEINLKNFFEMFSLMIEDEVKKQKAKLKLPKTKMIINADRDALMQGLESIILHLAKTSKKISIEANEEGPRMLIKYDSGEILKLTKDRLIDYLKSKNEHFDIFFQINAYLMNMSGIQAKFKEGLIELEF